MKTLIAIAALAVILVIALLAIQSNKSSVSIAAQSHADKSSLSKATLAGGCFWCMEPPFEKLSGIVSVVSGYTGGTKLNPTYKEVSAGGTGHTEAVEITYDPELITYDEILEIFWRNMDPTDADGQFVDRGKQYRSGIFYHTEQQKQIALASKDRLAKSGTFASPIVTEITAVGAFYAAEDYHQDYYKKNPIRYKYYRNGSGRDKFLKKFWGAEAGGEGVIEKLRQGSQATPYTRPSEAKIKSMLTPLQYEVTQREGTEPQYSNDYWKEKREGIYVDIVSGEPLFSSLHKYDSGTGWPSFTEALEPDNIVTRDDYKLFVKRVELRSKWGKSHLGHLFEDGPPPNNLRYCMNSAALRFIPKDELEQESYGKYVKLFN